MKEMVMKMKIKMELPRIRSDRERDSDTSSFLCKTNRYHRHFNGRNTNQFGEIYLRLTDRDSLSKKKFHENSYWNVFAKHMYDIFVQTNVNSKSDERTWITFRYPNGESTVILRKTGNSIFMNGVKKNQVDVSMALAKIIGYGSMTRCAETMDAYIDRNITYSANILYALQNRTPYWLFSEGTQYNVKINTNLISRDEVAFEISKDIWGSLPIEEANTFIDCYRNKAQRSKKWANISPSNLWFNMFGSHASESEEALMKAWLMQNRTDWIVEERAFTLLQSMDKKDQYTLVDLRKAPFSNLKLEGKSQKYHFAMHIKGQLGDWLCYPNNNQSGTQRCKLVFFNSLTDIQGPFCVDDVNGRNVMGDQISTRATLVYNDNVATEVVRTLSDVKKTNFRIPNVTLKAARFTEDITWR